MVDKFSGASVVIEVDHSFIHAEKFFTAHYESEAPLPTAVGAETAISFRTPTEAVSAKRVHMIFDVWANDESIFEFREGPTIVLNNQTTLPILNRFRSSANTSVLLDNDLVQVAGQLSSHTVIQAAVADRSGGTILHPEALAAGGAPPFGGRSNAMARAAREWVLDFDTDYVFILTNSTINDTVHNIILNWYEHADSQYGH